MGSCGKMPAINHPLSNGQIQQAPSYPDQIKLKPVLRHKRAIHLPLQIQHHTLSEVSDTEYIYVLEILDERQLTFKTSDNYPSGYL
jgi:hypothetical protein